MTSGGGPCVMASASSFSAWFALRPPAAGRHRWGPGCGPGGEQQAEGAAPNPSYSPSSKPQHAASVRTCCNNVGAAAALGDKAKQVGAPPRLHAPYFGALAAAVVQVAGGACAAAPHIHQPGGGGRRHCQAANHAADDGAHRRAAAGLGVGRGGRRRGRQRHLQRQDGQHCCGGVVQACLQRQGWRVADRASGPPDHASPAATPIPHGLPHTFAPPPPHAPWSASGSGELAINCAAAGACGTVTLTSSCTPVLPATALGACSSSRAGMGVPGPTPAGPTPAAPS